jgi:sugar phosphate permease
VGGDEVFKMLSPGWYGVHQAGLERAIFNKTEFTADSTILIIGLVRSIIASIIAGFLAAFVANGNRNALLILSVLLLIVGILVQMSMGSQIPLWYNAIFLVLLIPMTILGGRLKTSASA